MNQKAHEKAHEKVHEKSHEKALEKAQEKAHEKGWYEKGEFYKMEDFYNTSTDNAKRFGELAQEMVEAGFTAMK